MTMFHVNLNTGDVGQCQALKGKCPFGPLDAHFTSAPAARSAYEASRAAVFATKARKLSLTKADAKKLELNVYQLNVAEVDDDILNSLRDFYEELGRSSYTAADKPETVNRIYQFMDKLYSDRSLSGPAGVFARAAYDSAAETLSVYGFKRKPKDAGDELILASFPDGIKKVRTEYDEITSELAAIETQTAIYEKPLIEWTDQEVNDVIDAIGRNSYGYYGSYSSRSPLDIALTNRRSYLIAAAKREKVLKVWDAMPDEAKDLYTRESLNQEIEKLLNQLPFPPYYYNSSNNNRKLSVEDIIAQEVAGASLNTKRKNDQLAEVKRYRTMLEKLNEMSA